MPGQAPPPSRRHGDRQPCPAGSDMACEGEGDWEAMSGLAVELLLEPSEPLVSPSPDPAPPEELRLAGWSQDGCSALDGFIQLEKRWLLWHEFMKEYSSLDDWLRLAERTAASPNSSQVLYVAAKEEMRKFENLRSEAGTRLVQLDGLARRNRTLVGLFRGAMATRLVAAVTACGERWDRLHATIESVCRRLRHFVSLREEFESGRGELMVWLAEMDLRLSEVEHLTGRSSCEKMKELQTFQVAVRENASRLNELLERGEALIQRSQPEDGEDIEAGLQDLMLYCAHVFEGVGRLHTRLLSMRLVYEDDWVLLPASDSGCPSETVLEEEGGLEKSSAPSDLQAPDTPRHPGLHPATPPPPSVPALDPQAPVTPRHPGLHHATPPPPSPPALDSPTLDSPTLDPPTLDHQASDHQALEWDPSVDIGGSVSHDDADSSYFSANPGLSYRDDSLAKDSLKRRSYHRFLESQSENTCPVVDLSVDRGCGQVCLGTVAPPLELRPLGVSGVGGACFSSCWMTSTPGRASPEPVTFDPARISAWLGQTPREDPGTRPCSKAVQTDLQCSEGTHCLRDLPGHSQPCHHDAWDPPLALCPTQSCDVKLPSDWMNFNTEPKTQCKHQASRECPGRHPLHHARGQRGVTGEQTTSCPLLWWLLLGMLLALVAWLVVGHAEPDCSRGNTMARSSHLVLRYINGPPPT